MSEQLSQLVKEWELSKQRRWVQKKLTFRTPFEFISYQVLGSDCDYDLEETIKVAKHQGVFEPVGFEISRDFIRRAFAKEIYNKPEIFPALVNELEFILRLDEEALLLEFFLISSKRTSAWPAIGVSIKEELIRLKTIVEKLLIEENNLSDEEKYLRDQRRFVMNNETGSYFLDHEEKRDQWQPVWSPGRGTLLEFVQNEVLFERADVYYGSDENGKWVITREDLHKIFREMIYPHKKWLPVLLNEIEHLLALEDPGLIAEGYSSLNRFNFWPDGVGVKEELMLMTEDIRKILTEEKMKGEV